MERTVLAPLDAVDDRVEFEVDSLAKRNLHQPIDDLLVVMAKNDVGSVDQCHVASELVENAGEFVRDIAPASDENSPRQLIQMKDLVGGDRVLFAFDVGDHWRRAGRDKDFVCSDFLTARKPNRTRPGYLRSIMENGHVVVGQCLRISTLDPRNL